MLEALAQARNYNAWITSLILPHLGDNPVELGSGLGYQTELLLTAGLPRVTVSEPTADGVRELADRFAGDPRVTCRAIDFTRPPQGEYSAVYAVNVLEHVADDVGALAGAAALVRAGGKVVVFVPAFPSAMSRFDRELGHYRRYTRETTHRAFVDAGLEPELIRYVNAPGLPLWFVWMRLLWQASVRWFRPPSLGSARRAGRPSSRSTCAPAVRTVSPGGRARIERR